ncbi:MAG: ATP-binding protein, partial [Chitinophagaceae bacterium]
AGAQLGRPEKPVGDPHLGCHAGTGELECIGEQVLEQLPEYGSYLELSFADNGIGFEPHFADKVFGLFSRLHTRAQFEGTGLGLAICRKVAENHGGTIEASSEPGAGATFRVLLPQ